MGQLEFDLRLDYERSLKENLIAVAKFAGEQMKKDLEDNGRPLKNVESKQEAYGIAAQQFVKVCSKEKALKGQMDDFLKLLDADGDPEKLQNFVNSWLAEPWEDTKLKTSKELVLERQTDLPAYVVPEWAKLLTGGVDVQQNCVYWTIRAWGDYITSQNIAHGQAYSFAEVEAVMNMEYKTPSGLPVVVNLCLIDSGYDADSTYDFCALNAEWALPVKGASNPMQNHFKISTVNKDSSKAYGMNLIIVDGGKYKDMIAGRMRKPNGRGSWMVYQGCDEEYADQVTAEHKINVKSGNKVRQEWVQKESHNDNHYLDAEVYALAAADTLGVRMLHLQSIQEQQPQQAPKRDEAPTVEENWIRQNDGWIQG